MRARIWLPAIALLAAAAGCGRMDVGSDLLWTSRFETGDFSEWTSVAGGQTEAYPTPPNTIAVSNDHAHTGGLSAALTITAGPDGAQESAALARAGGLPAEAYYSAWYYLPHSETVGTFWVLFKFRERTNADDPSTATELYDMDLATLPSGEMTLELYDHATAADIPLAVTDPVVPVEAWFQLEAFYRAANDATGRLTFWLDGQEVVDVAGPTSPTPWVEWDASSIGEDLTPETVTIYIDDCAVSRSRVGPGGRLTE
ncbi:MAG TPA: hypothetical protein VHO06_18840 [Polyangia bacterium]|nr:hypothetical protein [Polyangia bacterium]